MKIHDIIDLLYGELMHNGSVSSFINIACSIDNVLKGSLFFAFNENEIDDAIKKGAYAIVTDYKTPILDKEIFWINVKNLQNCVFKLIKQLLIINNVKLVFLHEIEFGFLDSKYLQDFALFKHVSSTNYTPSLFDDKNPEVKSANYFLEFLSTNIKKYVFTDSLILKSFCLDFLYSPILSNEFHSGTNTPTKNTICIETYNLLESKIKYKGNFYKIALPHTLIKFLQSLLEVLQQCDIDINLNSLNLILNPLNLTYSNYLTNQYSGRLLYVIDILIFPYLHSHISNYARHLTIINISPRQMHINSNAKFIHLKSIKEIRDILESKHFDIAIICGIEIDSIEKILTKTIISTDLFS